MFTRPGWGKRGMKVHCGAAANIPDSNLVSGLSFHECGKLRFVAGGGGGSTVATISSARIEDVKRADGTFFPVCDVLGTPSVTPFCHRNV